VCRDSQKQIFKYNLFLKISDLKMPNRLLMFSGAECVHCKEMDPIVEKLKAEAGIKITHLEVWHDSNNKKHMEQLDKDDQGNEFCGGVPFFYNEKTGKKICGNTSFEKLKVWAEGN
jgi:thiol-disulfide isomerase/thioredoxin